MARGISAEAREDILVQAFLTCPNISEISKKTKIPRPTIYTVIHTDSFQRKYSEARNEAVTGAIAYLQGKLGECAAVLVNTAIDTEVPAQIRVTPKNKTVNIIEQNKKEIFMDGCNENVIEFMTNDTRATLSFSQGRYKSVIRKLAEKHPEDCQIIADNEDGSICAHVPVSWLRISPPRQYTEEQRQQMGERLRQNRSENTVTQG